VSVLPSTSRLRSWRRRLASAEPPTNASFGAVQIPRPFPFPAAHCALRSALPQLRSPLLAVSLVVVYWWWSPSVSVSASLGIHSHRSQRSLASLAVAQEQEPPSVLGTPAPRLEAGWGRRTEDGGQRREESEGAICPNHKPSCTSTPALTPGAIWLINWSMTVSHVARLALHHSQPHHCGPVTVSCHCGTACGGHRHGHRPAAAAATTARCLCARVTGEMRKHPTPQGRPRSDPAGTWCQHPHPHTAHSPRAASEFRAAANCELLLTWPLAAAWGLVRARTLF
jgi:hypothetical protein